MRTIHINPKTKANIDVSEVASDFMSITPLGSGKEVGRSCIVIKYKGKTVMLDCGIHPAYRGEEAKPFLDDVDIPDIDLLLVSHFHLDHAACVPYLLEKTRFQGRVFMTHPTKSIYKLILQDFVKISSIQAEQVLFTEDDLSNSMAKIETIDFHEQQTVNGIKFQAFYAGHVLGAAMFQVEIGDVKILYTGDYSMYDDRHLRGAEIPSESPDILLVESTFGVQQLRPIEQREKDFLDIIHRVVKRGGRCLIPVFAMGRAQELMLIVDEYWAAHPELQNIPIYYASNMAKKSMQVYTTFRNMMSDRFQDDISLFNPFDFRHIKNLKSRGQFQDIGPSVVFASPGMLQSGMSRELFEQWAPERKNAVIVAGYCVQGTMARTVQSEPNEVKSLTGFPIQLNMSVHYIRFAAHADCPQTQKLIGGLSPQHVILLHGEKTGMGRLGDFLGNQFPEMNFIKPENCQTVEIEFRRKKEIRVVGKLANTDAKLGTRLSGLMVKKDFHHQLIQPEELGLFSPMSTTEIDQELLIHYSQPFDNLSLMLSTVYEIEKEDNGEIRVHDVVTVKHKKNTLTLRWTASPVHDAIADSIVGMVMTLQTDVTGGVAKILEEQKEKKPAEKDWFDFFLKEHFGENIKHDASTNVYSVKTPDASATIKLNSRKNSRPTVKISASSTDLQNKLELLISCIDTAIYPIQKQKTKRRKKKKKKKLKVDEVAKEVKAESSSKKSKKKKVRSPRSKKDSKSKKRKEADVVVEDVEEEVAAALADDVVEEVIEVNTTENAEPMQEEMVEVDVEAKADAEPEADAEMNENAEEIIPPPPEEPSENTAPSENPPPEENKPPEVPAEQETTYLSDDEQEKDAEI